MNFPNSSSNSSSESNAKSKNIKVDNTYPYAKYILPPSSLGASTAPTISALSNDVGALIAYVQVLTSGNSRAQAVGPLGNKYFENTGGTCKDAQGNSHKRYVYYNNIPDGTIPFISSAMKTDTSSSKGLVPGILQNIGDLDPTKLFTAFEKQTTCQKIKMPIRDINNNTREEEQYVVDSDIKSYNPCWFPGGVNPVTKNSCRQGMRTADGDLPNDKIFQLYTLSIYVLGAYIMYCLVKK